MPKPISILTFEYQYDGAYGFETVESWADDDLIDDYPSPDRIYGRVPTLFFPRAVSGDVFGRDEDINFFRFIMAQTTETQRRKARLTGDTVEWLTLPFQVFAVPVKGSDVLPVEYLRPFRGSNVLYHLRWPMKGVEPAELCLCRDGMETMGLIPGKPYWFKLALEEANV